MVTSHSFRVPLQPYHVHGVKDLLVIKPTGAVLPPNKSRTVPASPRRSVLAAGLAAHGQEMFPC